MAKFSDTSCSRKRQRAEEIRDDTDETLMLDEGESLELSDAAAALRIMRDQFPHVDKVSIQPFVLRSQLYSIVRDRTQVDKELECLRQHRLLRVFKLVTGQDDHAIMFLEDYLKQILLIVTRLEEKHQCNLEVFDWFKTHVIGTKLDLSINHQELCYLLSHGGNVKDEHVSLLMNAGLLTRQLMNPHTYWFAIPSIGPVLKALMKGRKEILSLLNRRRYKEMMLVQLEKKRLRRSSLGMRFHLDDLIGSGHLKSIKTPTGIVVRVSRD